MGHFRTPRVALETTLLLHGVPRSAAAGLAAELGAIVRNRGAVPAFAAVVRGEPRVGLSDAELADLLATAPGSTPKLNTANLGVAIHRKLHGATTVSTTMELAAGAGVRLFATGGLGGVHRGYASHPDISADLMALTHFPVAVVASGVKSILDVAATREVLETLGVPVIGFGTDCFPAFYRREAEVEEGGIGGTGGVGGVGVDARFDDAADLAAYLRAELNRTNRGVLVCNPIPAEEEIESGAWNGWLAEASARAAQAGITGRDLTPYLLAQVHELSGGATLRANVALVKSNADLAARIAVAM